MAYNEDRDIAQLDPANVIQSTDLFALWQNGNTVRPTAAQVAQYIATGVPNPPSLPPYCLAYCTSNISWPSANILVPWQHSTGSMAGQWNISDPTKIIVPAGTTFVRISANFAPKLDGSTQSSRIYHRINDAGFLGQAYSADREAGGTSTFHALNAVGPPVPVVAGDAIQLRVDCSDAGARQIGNFDTTWLCAEFLN